MSASAGTVRPQTEALGRETGYLDDLAPAKLISTLIESQSRAITALHDASGQIGIAIASAAPVLRHPASRIVYCGAGTSGRVALLDAVELNPTFSWPEGRIKVLLAGGEQSFFEAQEGAEDDREFARNAINVIEPCGTDVVICLAASGTTPFVLEIAAVAKKAGALTVGIANNAEAPLLRVTDCPIFLDTGPEVLAGSTRLTAGTSQKIALNVISTSLMVHMGKVYRGRMVDMRATNQKLRARAVAMVMDITGCSEPEANAALEATRHNVKEAILVAHGATLEEAEQSLRDAGGDLGQAVRDLGYARQA
jgi:N-acetylmuramic acid 6-phosphate etherase